MLLGAVGLLVWSSAWFPGLYFGLLALQVGLLLASLDQPPRWGRTWRGLLLLGGLGLGVDFLLRALGLPLPSRAGHLVALGLGVLLGGGVVRWLYPRLAPKGPVRALAVVLPLLALTNSGLLFLATQERLDRLVLGFLLQVISAGPLLAFYLEALQHQRRSASIESVYAALLDTVAALPHRSEAELWSRLLASAVQVVPGAQAGSIRLRQGADFVFVAQQGFDEGVLGLRSSAHEAMAWHGDPLQWRRGQPRIANHADLQRIWATQAANCRLYERLNRASHQRIQQIRSTLCVPIPLGDEVMAEINLDAFHDRAFDHRSIEVARQYAQQVRALLAVHRQQSELEARVRELEVIEALSGALRGLKGTSEITRRLVYETIRLMNSEHAALLLLDPDGEQQRCYAAAGMFLEIKDTLVPRGWGLGWAAIETRAPIWLDQAHLDQRAYGQFRHPPEAYSEIVIPLLNSQGQPLGVLISARNGERAYLERDVRLLQIIGNIAANTLERVRANESLEAEIAEKTALLELSQMLGGNDAALLPAAMEKIRQMGHADAIALGVQEPDGYHLRWLTGHLGAEAKEFLQKPLPLEHPLVNLIPIEKAFRVGDTAAHPLLKPYARVGIRGLYLRTVVHEPELKVVLALMRLEPSPGWGPAEDRLLEGAAQILGALLLRLERTRQLETAYEGALRAIGLALEARDRETAGHTDRVAALVEQLGRALGLSEAELRDLRWGAYLHDVGKLALSDAILLKPDKLTPEEFCTMRTHTHLGDDLVRNLPFVPLAARQIVRHHHERWDGRGYPDGLAGEDIPLAARIFAVCAVFDALCSHRPYKTALSPEQAAQELWRSAQSGHLDQNLVKVFLETQGLEAATSQAAD